MDQFRHLHNLNVHSSCRTCLENLNDIYHDIFATPDLHERFVACTSLPVRPGDGYPTSLCEQCHTKINDFYNFRQMCVSARKQFQDYINSEKKPCDLELAMYPNNLTTDLMMVKKETKGEQEDSLASYACLEFVETEMSNVKRQEDSSAEEEEAKSDDDQPTIKYRVSENDTINNYSLLNKNENTPEDEKPTVKIKMPANKVIGSYCEICKKVFKKTENYTAHMRVHKGLKPFPCQLCDKSYARRYILAVHIKDKHEGRPEKKRRIMSSKQPLRKHIKDIPSGNDTKPKQSYICEECGKVLTSLATLKNHLFIHTGAELPHECPECDKRFITKNKLKEHMNKHAGIKKYTCPHCGAKKSTRTELTTHINYHTKEKTYPCLLCDKIFHSVGNLSRHTRAVHQGIKNYPCSYCDKFFGKDYTRRQHEMTHTGERPLECHICHKKFIQTSALKRHIKTHLKAVSTKGGEE